LEKEIIKICKTLFLQAILVEKTLNEGLNLIILFFSICNHEKDEEPINLLLIR